MPNPQEYEDWHYENQFCAVGPNSCCIVGVQNTVVWVFCESCNQWFHCPCIGLSGQKAQEEDFIFLCKKCQPRKEREFISAKNEIQLKVKIMMDKHPNFSNAIIG